MRLILYSFLFWSMGFASNASATAPVQTLKIMSPQAHATVRNNTQDLNLILESSIDRVALWSVRLNGVQIYLKPEIPKRLYPVYRGTHTLVVEAIDHSGKIIAVSDEIVFYKHQARIR